jgi:Protein of unknown function (DUF2905)
MGGLGRILIGAGVLLLVVGVVFIVAERAGLPLGRLPGDFSHQGKNVRVYFPLGTSILLSLLLSLILWLIGKWRG